MWALEKDENVAVLQDWGPCEEEVGQVIPIASIKSIWLQLAFLALFPRRFGVYKQKGLYIDSSSIEIHYDQYCMDLLVKFLYINKATIS